MPSGFFGGVGGNQGGLRAAALTTFNLLLAVFVATATASGLLVDVMRTPVYVWNTGAQLLPLALPIGLATAGVMIGTLIGERIRFGLSRQHFARLVGVAVGILGVWLLFGAA